MKKTINGRRLPSAGDIYPDRGMGDIIREKREYARIERTRETNERIAKDPVLQERRKNSKEADEKADARRKELKPIIEAERERLINEIMEYSKTHSAEASIAHFMPEIEKFKVLHDEYGALVKQSYPQYSGTYADIFYIISLQNPEFIIYSPVSIFTKGGKTLRLDALNENQLRELQSSLEENKLFSNEYFKRNYIKFFPDYIRNMTNIDDIFYALSRKPEMYKVFKNCPSFSAMVNNMKNYKIILSKSPKTLKYMSDDEIEFIASNSPSQIGLAINKCPEVITRLKNSFFDKYPPKQIFGTCSSKQDVLNNLSDYLSDYPTLKEYLTKFAYNTPKHSDDSGITF